MIGRLLGGWFAGRNARLAKEAQDWRRTAEATAELVEETIEEHEKFRAEALDTIDCLTRERDELRARLRTMGPVI